LQGREGRASVRIGNVPDDDVHDPVSQDADVFRIKPHVAIVFVKILAHAYRLSLLSPKSKYLLYVSEGDIKRPIDSMIQHKDGCEAMKTNILSHNDTVMPHYDGVCVK
jgi:hypothetical protein